MHAFEVTTWPCSEGYVKNPSIVRPAFELLTGPEGPSGLAEIFYGVEDGKSNAYGILNWDSMEAHEKFGADQETLLKFVKLFQSSAEGGIPKGTMMHVYWEEDAAVPCLKAPFMELTKISPKSGIATEAVLAVLDKYVAYMKDDPPSGFIGATYGHVVEEPRQLLLVAGWESSEACKDSVRKNASEVAQEMGEIAEQEVVSVSLTQFRRSSSRSEGNRIIRA